LYKIAAEQEEIKAIIEHLENDDVSISSRKQTLKRHGKPFYGKQMKFDFYILIIFGAYLDVKTRLKQYKSDYTDAFTFQTVTCVCFMSVAILQHVFTFGTLLGRDKKRILQKAFKMRKIAAATTGGALGIYESLVAQGLIGTLWAVFSAQPMLAPSLTGLYYK
jgi:hypothetical protein